MTKLQPPFVPAQVDRERLFARLRGGRGRRLTLVACPAGFGVRWLPIGEPTDVEPYAAAVRRRLGSARARRG